MRDLIKLAGVTLGKRFVPECFPIRIGKTIIQKSLGFCKLEFMNKETYKRCTIFSCEVSHPVWMFPQAELIGDLDLVFVISSEDTLSII